MRKMISADKKRFANALKTVISDLDYKAKGFGYRESAEYVEVRSYLTGKVEQLQKEAEDYD